MRCHDQKMTSQHHDSPKMKKTLRVRQFSCFFNQKVAVTSFWSNKQNHLKLQPFKPRDPTKIHISFTIHCICCSNLTLQQNWNNRKKIKLWTIWQIVNNLEACFFSKQPTKKKTRDLMLPKVGCWTSTRLELETRDWWMAPDNPTCNQLRELLKRRAFFFCTTSSKEFSGPPK